VTRRIQIFEATTTQSRNKEVPTMAPPRVGAPRKKTCKTRNNIWSPQETDEVEQETTQREVIIDVNANPLPSIELVSSILVEEEEKGLMMVEMEIYSHESEQGHAPVTTGNPQQPMQAESSHRKNGDDSEWTYFDTARPKTMVRFVQQEEGQVEDITGQPKSGMEEREPEFGTSIASVRRKEKKLIVWSPCKKNDVSIVLHHIPKGVQATPTLLACTERLVHLDHDVADTIKLP
jgi:hypothetical protein